MRNISTLRTAPDFTAYLNSLSISLPFAEKMLSGKDSPLAKTHTLHGRTIGNSFAILPMEGFDGTTDGHPTDLTRRRWQRFGTSGAKLIWLEATAVCPDGRGNPNQLMLLDSTVDDIARMREGLVKAHQERFGRSDDLMVGLQLTHSGRLAKPHDHKRREPKIVYHHPGIDGMFKVNPDDPVMTDGEISRLEEDFVKAGARAKKAGFDFVDIKHCHGYFGHELLSAFDRPGRYGGSFENRTRFLRNVVSGMRTEVPEMELAVRLSAFDFVPFQRGADGRGEPVPFAGASYRYAFGGDGTGLGIDLTEPLAFLDLMNKLDIKLLSFSAGAAYNGHILRPSIVSSADSYQPPEDPLVGVARLTSVAAELKQKRPDMLHVGTAYSYLQQWLPNVAQAIMSEGKIDFIGLGRMALCYPDIVADIIEGNPLKSQFICRSCNDCVTSLRFGLVSGCYSRDDFYRKSPGYEQLKQFKSKK
ncbi:MAG: hypothetical protein PHR56_08550 [Dehalococcoidales bacterium]|nr:hypothetical protein [Dehalococcoidales bacterium]